jgi:hypothetical protein
MGGRGKLRLPIDQRYGIRRAGADAEAATEAQVRIESKRIVHDLPRTEVASVNAVTTVGAV